jgi:hypothetical protein
MTSAGSTLLLVGDAEGDRDAEVDPADVRGV